MNFRTTLRDATRPEHDRLDRMFTALDIADRDGFADFINVHLICFQLMSDVAVEGSQSCKLLNQMANRLALDLDMLGGGGIRTIASLPKDIDPLAIDYLVAGSRLGSKVLQKRWLASNDSLVRRANKYFNLDNDSSFWHSTCEALAGIEPESELANVIVRDTKLLFNLFSSVYKSTVTTEAVTT